MRTHVGFKGHFGKYVGASGATMTHVGSIWGSHGSLWERRRGILGALGTRLGALGVVLWGHVAASEFSKASRVDFGSLLRSQNDSQKDPK